MKQVCAVVVAAGRGRRLKLASAKALAPLNSLPLFIHSLKALEAHPLIKEIILVATPENLRSVSAEIKKYRLKKVSTVVKGGRRRQDSVYQGLKAIGSAAGLVLIHDAARPFLGQGLISRAINAAARTGAAIAAVPVKATIKEVTSHKSQVTRKKSQVTSHKPQVKSRDVVKKTLERGKLWEAQTPQVFKKELILAAHQRFGRWDVTDDAALVEKLGRRVSVVMGSYSNIKITTPEDLVIAEAIAKL